MALPTPPAEVPVSRDRSLLPSVFNAKLDRVLARMEKQGHDPIIFEALRTDERQRFLWGFGRLYDDGRGVVTYSKTAERTWHGYGLAVDIISKRHAWNAPASFWTALGEACRAEGLWWGNDWDRDGVPVERDPDERMSDRPHVQWWCAGMPRSSANLAALCGLETATTSASRTQPLNAA